MRRRNVNQRMLWARFRLHETDYRVSIRLSTYLANVKTPTEPDHPVDVLLAELWESR